MADSGRHPRHSASGVPALNYNTFRLLSVHHTKESLSLESTFSLSQGLVMKCTLAASGVSVAPQRASLVTASGFKEQMEHTGEAI